MVVEIELYKILKTKFTETEAESIVESIEQKVHNSFEERKNDFATKEDIAKLEGRLETKMAESKTDIIKWMFIFWISQLASSVAIAKFLLK